MLPYSREVLFSLFGELNERFATLQYLALAFALFLAWQTLHPRFRYARPALFIGAALWAGAAYAFYLQIFAPLNFLAPAYAAVAAAQALAMAFYAALPAATPTPSPPPAKAIAIAPSPPLFLALAWPLADLLNGPGWPLLRFLGLHPAPLLLLTQALLLRLPRRSALLLAPLPLLLSGVSAFEAYVLALPQDALPLIAWLYTLPVIAARPRPR